MTRVSPHDSDAVVPAAVRGLYAFLLAGTVAGVAVCAGIASWMTSLEKQVESLRQEIATPSARPESTVPAHEYVRQLREQFPLASERNQTARQTTPDNGAAEVKARLAVIERRLSELDGQSATADGRSMGLGYAFPGRERGRFDELESRLQHVERVIDELEDEAKSAEIEKYFGNGQ